PVAQIAGRCDDDQAVVPQAFDGRINRARGVALRDTNAHGEIHDADVVFVLVYPIESTKEVGLAGDTVIVGDIHAYHLGDWGDANVLAVRTARADDAGDVRSMPVVVPIDVCLVVLPRAVDTMDQVEVVVLPVEPGVDDGYRDAVSS